MNGFDVRIITSGTHLRSTLYMLQYSELPTTQVMTTLVHPGQAWSRNTQAGSAFALVKYHYMIKKSVNVMGKA
jgi:hypothetical protein